MIITPDRNIVTPVRCSKCGRWREPRTLRTPRRFAPRWGRMSPILNVDTSLRVDTNGFVMVGADSKIFASDDPTAACCDCKCANCDPDTTPASLDVTLSSTIVCPGSFLIASPEPGTLVINGTTIDGTFPVVKVASPGSCNYTYIENPATTITGSFTDTHTGTPVVLPITFSILATRATIGGAWTLSARVDSDPPFGLGILFAGSVSTGSGDCTVPFSISNNFTTCFSNDPVTGIREYGHGGSAAATPNP